MKISVTRGIAGKRYERDGIIIRISRLAFLFFSLFFLPSNSRIVIPFLRVKILFLIIKLHNENVIVWQRSKSSRIKSEMDGETRALVRSSNTFFEIKKTSVFQTLYKNCKSYLHKLEKNWLTESHIVHVNY